jgi:predicted peptidase
MPFVILTSYMKKKAIKNFGHVLLFGALTILMSCGKDAVTPQQSLNIDDASSVAKAGLLATAGAFVKQTVGITVKKMDNQRGNISQYLLYIPTGYNEKPTYRWPVVIALHGMGETGTNINVLKNVGLPKVIAGKPFIMIAPQCLRNWWNIATLDVLYSEIIAKYNVDPKKVYLTGLSMGGFTTWDWSIQSPQKFAAIVPICGGSDPKKVASIKNVPVWAFHNADDPTVSIWNTRNMVNALKAIGGKVKYTEYPSGGHDAWTKTYSNAGLYTWLLAQSR